MSTRSEPAWKQAWLDLEHFRGSFIGFWVIEVLAALTGGIVAVWWLTSATSSPTAQAAYGGIGVAIGLGVAFVGMYAFYLAVAPYRQRNEARREVAELQTQIEKLKAQPKLDMVFRDEAIFKQIQRVTDEKGTYTETLFRVKVKHTGTATIDRVEVRLENIAPLPRTLLGMPLPLHPMNYNTPENRYRSHFPLDAGQRQFVDVMFKRDYDGEPASNKIFIYHAVYGVDGRIPAGRYRIALCVHGQDVAQKEKHFIVDVDAGGALQFEAATSSS
jgi:hypothetical protein